MAKALASRTSRTTYLAPEREWQVSGKTRNDPTFELSRFQVFGVSSSLTCLEEISHQSFVFKFPTSSNIHFERTPLNEKYSEYFSEIVGERSIAFYYPFWRKTILAEAQLSQQEQSYIYSFDIADSSLTLSRVFGKLKTSYKTAMFVFHSWQRAGINTGSRILSFRQEMTRIQMESLNDFKCISWKTTSTKKTWPLLCMSKAPHFPLEIRYQENGKYEFVMVKKFVEWLEFWMVFAPGRLARFGKSRKILWTICCCHICPGSYTDQLIHPATHKFSSSTWNVPESVKGIRPESVGTEQPRHMPLTTWSWCGCSFPVRVHSNPSGASPLLWSLCW